MAKFRLILLLTGMACLLAAQDTLYVSVGGDNSNPGTFEEPVKGLQRAIDLSSAGDLIYVRGGVYQVDGSTWYSSKEGVRISKDGTATQRSRIFNYPGETPVFDFSALNNSYLVGIRISGDYWHLKGLHVRNVPLTVYSNSTGIKIENGNHNIIEQCVTYQIEGSGIRIEKESSYNYLVNCDAYNNYDVMTNGGNADGFQIAFMPRNTYNYIIGCRAWQNSDDGYDLYTNEGYVYIANSMAWKNGYVPGTNEPSGDGSGFKLGRTDEERASEIQRVVTNCVAFGNRQNGFYNNSGNVDMLLYNCTSFDNKERGFLFHNTGVEIRNCVAYQDDIASTYLHESTVQSNNTWQGIDVQNSDFLTFDTMGVAGPRNADGSIVPTDFLRPSETGQLYEEGSVISNSFFDGIPGADQYPINEYKGSAPEIGALEAGSCPAINLVAEITHTATGESNGAINVTVSGGQSPYTFSWSNGSSGEDISGLAAGQYALTATSSEGCSATGSWVVEEEFGNACEDFQLSAVITDTDEGLSNGSIDLSVSGSYPPYTYNWSIGSTSQDISGLSAGNYGVTVTNGQECQKSTSYTVDEIPDETYNNTAPNVSVAYQDQAFESNTYQIDASGTYDADGDAVAFQWTVPDGVDISNQESNVLSFLPEETEAEITREFKLEVSDGNTSITRVLPIKIMPYRKNMEELTIAGIESSSYEHTFYPDHVIDNDPETYWMVEGDNHWLTIDLQEPAQISHFKLAFFEGQYRKSFFDLYVSVDRINWTPIGENLSSCGFSNMFQVFECPNSYTTDEYRYLKLVAHGNSDDDLYTISELKVYGTSAEATSIAQTGMVDLHFYPQPATELLNIETSGAGVLSVIDVEGKVCLESSLQMGENQLPINLRSGFYILRFEGDDGSQTTEKLIVQ